MKLSTLKTFALSTAFAALIVAAHVEYAAASSERAVTTSESSLIARWADRTLARVEGWISRMRDKLDGRDSAMMEGCGEMMTGTGMMQGNGEMMGNMHGTQPNDQWRAPDKEVSR